MFVFVLLGDLRVFVLIFGLALRPGSWIAAACGYALVVPLFAGAVYGGLGLVIDDLHGQVLWLAYELGFVAMATYLARVWIPRHVEDSSKDGAELAGILRSCAAFSAAYYSLWAAADLMVLAGLDEGWAVRVVPNQLYYAFWVPFVYARYFSSSRAASSSQQATSSSTQAAR
jgi:hypothetical protein